MSVIDKIQELIDDEVEDGYTIGYLRQVQEWIKSDGVYALFGDGWRDTRKVKPPRQDCYLVYDSEGSMFLCAYDTEFRHDGGIDGKAEIIAWRPLPDPPAFA